MASIFISHSSLDGAFAAEIKEWLAHQEFTNTFLDFDKDTGIGAGGDWAHELYAAVSNCQAVIVVATPNWSRSRWCFAEAQQARALGKSIFPVVAKADDVGTMEIELRHVQAVVWNAAGKESLASRLRGIIDNLARGYKWDRKRAPWSGIQSLSVDDAAVFFGRDQEIVDIAQRLNVKRTLGGPPLTFLVGASGSGKSSLLRAGVVPYLMRSSLDWIVLPPFRPGSDPLTALKHAFALALDKRGVGGGLPRANYTGEAFDGLIETLRRDRAPDATVVISIDQIEELFSAASAEDRKRFFALLGKMLANEKQKCLALATVRSDRLGDFLTAERICPPHDAITISPMPRERLRSVIEGPASVAGIVIEPALVDRILDDAAVDEDVLPLVAFALREMYERRDNKNTLSIFQYEQLGDPARGLRPLDNVVRRTAEAVIASSPVAKADVRIVKEAFVSNLVQIGQDGARAAKPARLTDISAEARPVLEALVQARLLTTRGEGEQRQIEISHEALLRVWPQLSSWLDEEQEFLLGRRQIEQARVLWESAPADKKSDALLSGLLLQRAREWYAAFPNRFAGLDDFVKRSLDREQALSIRRRRQTSLALAIVLSAVVGLAGLTLWALTERGEATTAAGVAAQQRDNALHNRSRLLAEFAQQANSIGDFGSGAALAAAALTNPYDGKTTGSPEAERALRHALWNLRELYVLNVGNQLAVNVVLFSPDGKRLLTGSSDGVARLWDVGTGQLVKAMIGHAGGISRAAFAHDGLTIATGDLLGGLRIWRGDTGELLRALHTQDGRISWLSFSRDDKRLLYASWAGARIHDLVGDAREIELASGKGGHVWTANFSPDEQTILSAGEEGISLFSARDGQLLWGSQNIRGVLSAAYSPKGDSFATVDRGGSLISWDTNTKAVRFRVDGANVACTDCMMFSPDGTRIAVGSKGGVAILDSSSGQVIARTRTVDVNPSPAVRFLPNGQAVFNVGEGRSSARLDQASDGRNLETFSGHADDVLSIAVSPDGRTFATGAKDGTARLWAPFPVAGSSYVPATRQTWMGYSPEGRTVAVAEQAAGAVNGLEGALGLYDAEAKTYRRLEPHHNDFITIGGFSADGKKLLSVSQGDGVFRLDGRRVSEPPMMMLWNAQTGKLISELARHADRVNSAVFAPDSSRLATASNDGTAHLYDAVNGSLIATLSGHLGVVTGAFFSPSGHRLLTISGDRTARLWDGNAKAVKVLEGHSEAIRHAAFSTDGSVVATGSDDFSIRVWRSENGQSVATLAGHGGQILSLAFPSNNRVVSASADGTVRLWSLDTLQPLVTSYRRSYNGGAASVSDDGKYVSMSWGDQEVRVFDVETGALVSTLKTLSSEQFQYFIPKSHLLMVVSNYGLELWSLPLGEKIGEMTLPFAFGHNVRLAPSGDRFMVADGRGLRDFFVWPTTSILLNAARRLSTHDLSMDPRYSQFLQ